MRSFLIASLVLVAIGVSAAPNSPFLRLYESYLWILQTLLLTHPDLHPGLLGDGGGN